MLWRDRAWYCYWIPRDVWTRSMLPGIEGAAGPSGGPGRCAGLWSIQQCDRGSLSPTFEILPHLDTFGRMGGNPLGLAMPCTRREGILPPCASRGGRATGVRPSISSARLRACARNAKTQVSKFCGFLFVVILTCVRNTVRCERPVATCYDLHRTCQLRATGLNLATGLPARTKREGDPTGESVIRAARALADASRARLVSRW